MVLASYNGPQSAREFFKPLLELKPDVNTTAMKSFAESG